MARERLSRGGLVLLLVVAVAAVVAAATAGRPEAGEGGAGGGAAPEKLHPTIGHWLAVRPHGDRARVIVTFAPGASVPEAELARHGGRVLERFWINNSALVELPIGSIVAVAARPDVRYVQPEEGGEPPPGG